MYLGGDLSKAIDEQIAWWVIWNSLPFRIVEHREFRDFIRSLSKNYNPPRRDKLKKIINDLYTAKSNQVKLYLADVKWYSLTSDGWKDTSNQITYIGVTLHYIDNYELFSICLKANHFEGDATAERIQSSIEKSCNELGVNMSSFVSITTDSASNYSKAGRNIASHIHCVAHRLNLVVEDSL